MSSIHRGSLRIKDNVLMDVTAQKKSSSHDVTTYLCYSPTCTPAQLSLLSEAIARYSAFLERKQKKHADYQRV